MHCICFFWQLLTHLHISVAAKNPLRKLMQKLLEQMHVILGGNNYDSMIILKDVNFLQLQMCAQNLIYFDSTILLQNQKLKFLIKHSLNTRAITWFIVVQYNMTMIVKKKKNCNYSYDINFCKAYEDKYLTLL